MNTGLRKGEILGLQWEHIDLRGGFIRLTGNETKEKQQKRIPINTNVKTVLGSIPRSSKHDYIISYHGKPIAAGLRKSMMAACKAIGITYGMDKPGGLRFHDLRTSVKTYMLKAGIDKAIRDTILGHSLEGMDMYYIKPTDQDLHDAMVRYTKWLDEQVRLAKAKAKRKKGTQSGTHVN